MNFIIHNLKPASMINLESFFKNPFNDSRLSLDNKKRFGEDAIQRFGVQNTANQFDQLITDIVAAQTALFGSITNVATNLAIQQSRTMSVDNIVVAFTKRNTQLNQHLIAEGTNVLPMYQEFFPLGVQKFTTEVNKSNVQQKMTEIISAITAHTPEAGGAAVLTQYQGFLSSYITARGSQLTTIGQVSSGINTKQTNEDAWDDQFFHALLTVADLHRNDAADISLYFNQSILRTSQASATDGQGRITGICRRTADNVLLAGMKVHVIDGNIDNAETDSNGAYTTQYLPVGGYSVEYTLNGVVSKTEHVTVVDDGDTLHDVGFVAE